MTEQYANDAQTTLASAAGSGDTTITVASATGFPASGNFRIRIDGEIVLVTAVSGTSWTVSRAVEAVAGVSAAAAHSSGALVTHVLTAASVALAGFSMPSGAIVAYGGSAAPSGWLICDGSAVSRTTYATLYGVLGTTYGSGDGSTTFNLPDLRDRAPLGVSPGALGTDRPTARTLGSTGGTESQTLATTNLPSHSHTVTDPGHTHAPGSGADFVYATVSATTLKIPTTGTQGVVATTSVTASATTGITIGNTGSGSAFGIMPPWTCVNYIIKT